MHTFFLRVQYPIFSYELWKPLETVGKEAVFHTCAEKLFLFFLHARNMKEYVGNKNYYVGNMKKYMGNKCKIRRNMWAKSICRGRIEHYRLDQSLQLKLM